MLPSASGDKPTISVRETLIAKLAHQTEAFPHERSFRLKSIIAWSFWLLRPQERGDRRSRDHR
jgi:hypothetical protein